MYTVVAWLLAGVGFSQSSALTHPTVRHPFELRRQKVRNMRGAFAKDLAKLREIFEQSHRPAYIYIYIYVYMILLMIIIIISSSSIWITEPNALQLGEAVHRQL